MNKEALKILLKYRRFSRKTNSFHELTKEEFEVAKKAGFMFDTVTLSHNQAIDWLIEVKEKVVKEHVTSLFLASLSSDKVEWSCGLPAYVLSRHFPHHLYSKTHENDSSYCPVCGDIVISDPQEVDLSLYNYLRFTSGCAMTGDDMFQVSLLAFCLEQHVNLPKLMPTKDDVAIMKEILNVISQAGETDTPNQLEKSLASKKLFKSNHWQRRYLLEALGFCNIIENPGATGYTSRFIQPNKRHRDSHISEWNYPIRLWRGKDGINKDALTYWFGDFL